MSEHEVPLRTAWRSFHGRLAVAGGSLVGLVSLVHHVPVSTACARGAVCFVALLVVGRVGGAALARAHALDRSAVAGRGRDGRSA